MNTDIPPPSDADKAIDLAAIYTRPPVNGDWVYRLSVESIIRRCHAAEQKIEVLVSHNVAVIKERDAALSELSSVREERDAAKYLLSVVADAPLKLSILEQELAALRAKVVSVLGSLIPPLPPVWALENESCYSIVPTVGECRRAVELLAELKQGPRPNGEEGDV